MFMASSSMITTTPQNKYQVFLSFRGEDTCHNFTSHLYEALRLKTVVTFIDDELKKGDKISASLLRAIQESTISVIIFSKTYASSRWSLNEVVEIIRCMKTSGQIVIPVFYHVDPSQVRKQSEEFGQEFAVLQERFKDRVETVQSWRSALTEAGNLSGWHIDGKMYEAKCIKEIVNDILKRMGSSISPMGNSISPSDYKNLVGVESSIEKIESLLNGHDRSIGIWGIGGVGKTTLARIVFNKFSCHFHKVHFLQNVREGMEAPNGLLHMRKELLNAILRDKHANIESSTTKQRLSLMKILIVFDDVTSPQQIEDLIGDFKNLSSDSRIMITTRDRQVLHNCGVDHLHEVNTLSTSEGLQLFGQHAFKLNYIPQEYNMLSNELVCYANGLPLALKVLGRYVFGKSKEFWESTIRKLQKSPLPEIDRVLKISYDGLEVEEQDIFLDLACFFKGMNRDLVMDILDACGLDAKCGIDRLIDKCLITTSFDGMIMMPDLIEAMGRQIVMRERDLDKRSRLWSCKDIKYALTQNKGSEATRGIWLDMFEREDILHLKPSAFSKMYRLMFLKVSTGFNNKVHGFSNIKSDITELRYLHWPGYQCKSLPLNFRPENLVSLEMKNSNLEQLWTGIENLVHLKYVDLSNSIHLLKIPDLSKATNLTNLNLDECASLIEITLPPTQNLKLVNLSLRNCRSLNCLPPGIQGKSLILSGCTSLNVAPKISSETEELWLDGTAVKELSTSIKCPSSLIRLNLENCSRLETLPFGICKWKSLLDLTLSGCSNLKTIPNLPFLIKKLYLDGTAIEELPSSIGHLSYLKHLSLSGCSKLDRLPDDFGNLAALERLEADGIAIKEVPSSFGRLQGLSSLNFNQCRNLELPTLSCLQSLKKLEELELADCRITELPSVLFNLSSLWFLDLSNNNFESIPTSIINLSCLDKLTINHCKSLQSLPKLPYATHEVAAMSCTSLQALSDFRILTRDNGAGYFHFFNCFNVDWDSMTDVVIEDLHESWKARVTQRICFPGREIPKWFTHQGSGSSIELPPGSLINELDGFAYCIVLSFLQFLYHEKAGYLKLYSYLGVKEEDDNYEEFVLASLPILRTEEVLSIESDHLLMGYIPCDEFPDLSYSSDAIVKFHFSLRFGDGSPRGGCQVKNSGVHLFFKQDSKEAEPNSIKLQISNPFEGESRSRNLHDEREEGEEPQPKRSKISNPFEDESSSWHLHDEKEEGEEPQPKRSKISNSIEDESISRDSQVIKYDVFLSFRDFRGEDTQYNFTSHIHAALSRAKIESFFDDELKIGDDFSSSIAFNAIEESTISVIIFSKGYASSKCCLDELVKILQRKKKYDQVVIPVCYHVTFAELEKVFEESSEMFQRWRSALQEAANLFGFEYSSNDKRYEADLVDDIVKHVSKILTDMYPSDNKDLVGVQSSIEKVESLLRIGSKDFCIVGIWGPDGIGKTTIAMATFKKIKNQFDNFYFALNVREELENPNGLTHLQQELLCKILKDQHLNMGFTFMKQRLGRNKVLIVFDDVTSLEQIKSLIGDLNYLGLGSRIIVTARDRQVLKNCGVHDDNMYEVKALSHHEPLQLFSWYAFQQSRPLPGYNELSNIIVRYAQGVPLVIKMLGSFLRGQAKKVWQSARGELENIPHNDIQRVLKICFDGLNDNEKNIFLDIACFLKQEDRDFIIKFLDVSDFFAEIGISVLVDKCFINLSNKKIRIHDLLEKMGWKIVKQENSEDPGKRSRLWHPDDIFHVLQDNKGSKAIEGICLDMSKTTDILVNFQSFANMQNLRFLKIFNSHSEENTTNKVLVSSEGLECVLTELRYLCWHGYPLKSLRSNCVSKNLVAIDMPYCNVEQLWIDVKDLFHLKRLDLSHSKHLHSITGLSSAAPNLEILILEGCISLSTICASIKLLNRLVILNLRHCKSLCSLPEVSCTIEQLFLEETTIEELLIENLSRLVALDIKNCSKLKNLPCNIGNLKFLEHLNLSGCSNLDGLPDNLGNLEALKVLKAERVAKRIPSSLDQLSSMESLFLGRNSFQALPTNILHLSKLSYLDICYCKRLEFLPPMPYSLQCLNAHNCKLLEASSRFSILFPTSSRSIRANFINCFKLDENALIAFLNDVLQKMHDTMTEVGPSASICFPGSEIPSWFSFQSTGSSIKFELASDWFKYKFVTFAVCAIVEFENYHDEGQGLVVGCECKLRGRDGSVLLYYGIGPSNIEFDHIFLGYDLHSCSFNLGGSRYTDINEVSIKFYVEDSNANHIDCCMVKKCGAHLVYCS